MCIAAGCDYLANVKGVGIHIAYRFVSQPNGDLLERLLKVGGSEECKNYFRKVEKVFKHQTVFNMDSHSTAPLEKCETNLTEAHKYCQSHVTYSHRWWYNLAEYCTMGSNRTISTASSHYNSTTFAFMKDPVHPLLCASCADAL